MKNAHLGFLLISSLILVVGVPMALQNALQLGPKANQAALDRVYGKLAQAPWEAQQQKGDIAVGVIVNESNGKIYLDGKPCEKKIYNFTAPYDKDATGRKVSCGQDSFDEYRVRQK